MKILLKNIPNTYNYGSMMMAENIITYLNKNIKNIEFYTEAVAESDLIRLRKATKYKKIFRDPYFDNKLITQKIKYIRFIEKLIRDEFALKKACEFYDCVIVLGGDDYAETYYRIPKDTLLISKLFKELQYFNKKTKLYMVGQTIGPFTGKRIDIAKRGFENVKIFSRDFETTKYMKETFGYEISTSRDLAFLDLNLQNSEETKNVLKKYNLKKNDYITLVGTGLYEKYATDSDQMLKTFNNIIEELKNKYKDKKIVYLAHVTTPNAVNDITFLDMLQNYIKKNDDYIFIKDKILPAEARMILGHGYFTLTFRMHAAVSTFQMGKPAICLSYSKKYKGVIADGLDMSKLVIDAKGDSKWNKKLVKNVMNTSDYIDENYKNLQIKIKKQVNVSKKIVNDMIDQIVEDILNKE